MSTKRPWTWAEEMWLEWCSRHPEFERSASTIAVQLGRSKISVKRKAANMGVHTNGPWGAPLGARNSPATEFKCGFDPRRAAGAAK